MSPSRTPSSAPRRRPWPLFLVILAALLLSLAVLQSRAQQQTPQESPPGELETFVPSETLSADSAVAFPVDI